MAYHYRNKIEILEEQENDGPEAFGSTKVVIATPWADVKTMKGNEFQQWRLTANIERELIHVSMLDIMEKIII